MAGTTTVNQTTEATVSAKRAMMWKCEYAVKTIRVHIPGEKHPKRLPVSARFGENDSFAVTVGETEVNIEGITSARGVWRDDAWMNRNFISFIV